MKNPLTASVRVTLKLTLAQCVYDHCMADNKRHWGVWASFKKWMFNEISEGEKERRKLLKLRFPSPSPPPSDFLFVIWFLWRSFLFFPHLPLHMHVLQERGEFASHSRTGLPFAWCQLLARPMRSVSSALAPTQPPFQHVRNLQQTSTAWIMPWE